MKITAEHTELANQELQHAWWIMPRAGHDNVLQACIRGWRDRHWIMHNITVPRVLQQCTMAKQALQLSR